MEFKCGNVLVGDERIGMRGMRDEGMKRGGGGEVEKVLGKGGESSLSDIEN